MLIQTDPVQNFLVKKVTNRLSHDLKTEVKIDHISFTFFNRMDLDGTLIRDLKKDTLLYAGALKVRITDWFFLKKSIELKYIGLENAVIYQNRVDSGWNYQFLIDHFSSSKKDTTKKEGITLNLKKVDLKNVFYLKNDKWLGERMKIRIGSLLLDADNIDFNKLVFKIKNLELDKPQFLMENFPGKRPPNKSPVKLAQAKDTGMYFNSGNMSIVVDSFRMVDGQFTLLNNNHPHQSEKGFDANNIEFKHINLSAHRLRFDQDTIRAAINLNTIERSGLNVKNLSAQFKLTPQIMEFKNLDLRTANSHLHNYFAMHFHDFSSDMNDFTDKVKLDARFNNALVNSDDIGYFAPELKTWKKRFTCSGEFLGIISDFSTKDLMIKDESGMMVSGNLSMKGLPDINHTIIDVQQLTTDVTYAQLLPIVPSLSSITSPNLKALGKLIYKGSFHGSVYDFNIKGNLSTSLGAATTDLNLSFPQNGEPSYKGKLVTKQFDLGKFIDNENFGIVSFNGKFEGRSFSLKSMKSSLDGHFDNFEALGYNYTNIDVNGTFQKKYFTGELKINDPNANFLSNIEIDLNGDKPKFNVLGDLVNLDLKKTNLTKENLVLTALFDLNFAGNNIDDFLGSAKILNVAITKDSNTLSFDSLTLSASIDSNKYKVLTVDNNEFNATIRGQYSILDLPTTFQSFLSNYYPAFIKKPAKIPKHQNFSIDVNTRDFDSYAFLLDSNLHGFDSLSLKGGVNTDDSGSFYFNLMVPFAKYKNFSLIDTKINGKGDFSKIDFGGQINKLYVNDSSYFPNTNLIINSQNDHSLFQLTTGSNNTINEVNLAADIYNLSDGIKIDFRPSYFVLNDKKWNLEKEGEIILRKDFASANNVKFSQGFQELTVSTRPGRRDSTYNNLVVKLSKVNIGDFVPLFLTSPQIEGLVSGQIVMINFFGDFSIADSLSIDQFRLNGDSIGLVNTNGFYSAKQKNIRVGVNSDNKDYKFIINGRYDLHDSIASPLDINLQLQDTKINILNQFLNSLFSNIQGKATGQLEIKGTIKKFQLLGQASIHNASMDVNYTKVRYFIDTAGFTFNNGDIDFGNFNIKDKYGNVGKVRGVLYHDGFTNMKYDFDLSSNKILVLDTKATDNERFYGKAIANAQFSLKGTEANMLMSIKGSVADSSLININTTTTAENSDADFIVFKKYGKEILKKEETNSDLTLDLDLTANSLATINVILDPLTGDVIKAKGNGRLRIHIPPRGDMTMNGKYNIEKGSYEFNFQTLVKRPFEFIDGANNFIEWTGDAYNANLHIDAQYTAQQVSINNLINNQSAIQGQAGLNNIRGYRGDVYVIVELRGHLLKPDIGFRIDFPTGSSVKSDPDFALFLTRMQADENEMLKQVTYLIMFNSFAPYGQSGGNSGSFASAGVNTISSLVTGELNNLFSNALTKLTGDKGLHFEVGASTYSSSSVLGDGSSSSKLDRQSVNFKLYQSIANDKIIITLGSNLDFGLGSSSTAVQNGSFQYLPDFSVQFVLTRDRKLRAIVFNRSSLGVAGVGALGRQNRYGVSISYTKDFERFFGDNRSKFREIPLRNDTLRVSNK